MNSIKLFETNALKDKIANKRYKPTVIEPWKINHLSSREQQDQEIPKVGFIKVQVSDTGCGIPQDRIPRLFNMFEQAHQSVVNMHGGTGLGLWICRQICQKMGGDITLYSQVDQGTSFVFYIAVNNDRQNMLSLPSISALRREVNVLVVDDYAMNRDLHKLLLQKEGAHVVTACNGREAVNKYEEKCNGFFDLILMDVCMPELDGFEAAKMIRQFEIQNNRRIVDICFISGEYFSEEETINSFKRTGGEPLQRQEYSV